VHSSMDLQLKKARHFRMNLNMSWILERLIPVNIQIIFVV
jgi:hypothetical protein